MPDEIDLLDMHPTQVNNAQTPVDYYFLTAATSEVGSFSVTSVLDRDDKLKELGVDTDGPDWAIAHFSYSQGRYLTAGPSKTLQSTLSSRLNGHRHL